MSLPVLDRAVLESLRRLNQPGEPDLLHQLLALFIAEAPARLASIDGAVEAGDAPGLRRAAHALKGSAAAIGATALQQACGDLEDMARSGALNGAREGAEAMRAAYATLHAEIGHLL